MQKNFKLEKLSLIKLKFQSPLFLSVLSTIDRIQAEQDTEVQAQQTTINRLEVERKAETEAQRANIA